MGHINYKFCTVFFGSAEKSNSLFLYTEQYLAQHPIKPSVG